MEQEFSPHVPYFLLPAWVVVGLVLLNGCGSEPPERPMAFVSGKITYQGKPLDKGQVVMIHNSGQTGGCFIKPDGSYRLQAQVGDNRVMIRYIVDAADLPSPREGKGEFDPKNPIPDKYTDYTTSGLAVKVVEGENTKDWALTD